MARAIQLSSRNFVGHITHKMANPIYSLSRSDKRPPAGVNPPLPEWAKGDYVLENWVKEERQRRRNWLMDQRLDASEPRPEWRPNNRLLDAVRNPFSRLITPVDNLLGNRLRPLLFKGGVIMKWFVLPMWATHYFVKYHLATTPGKIVTSKLAEFPEDPTHGASGAH